MDRQPKPESDSTRHREAEPPLVSGAAASILLVQRHRETRDTDHRLTRYRIETDTPKILKPRHTPYNQGVFRPISISSERRIPGLPPTGCTRPIPERAIRAVYPSSHRDVASIR